MDESETEPRSDFTFSPETREKIAQIARLLEEQRRRDEQIRAALKAFVDNFLNDINRRNDLLRQLQELASELLD